MYSIILLAGMTAGADVPQGLFFNRPRSAGCAGTVQTIRVRQAPVAPVRTAMWNAAANLNDARPHLFGRFIARVDARTTGWAEARAARTGCDGGTSLMRVFGFAGSLASQTVTKNTTATYGAPVLLQACPNGVCPTPEAPEATAALGGFLERARVGRQLRVALRRGGLTHAQSKIANRVLTDPAVFAGVEAHVTNSLSSKMASQKVGALGDGRILDAILSRLPAILEAAKKIIDFIDSISMADPTIDARAMPLPIGPAPVPVLVPQLYIAC